MFRFGYVIGTGMCILPGYPAYLQCCTDCMDVSDSLVLSYYTASRRIKKIGHDTESNVFLYYAVSPDCTGMPNAGCLSDYCRFYSCVTGITDWNWGVLKDTGQVYLIYLGGRYGIGQRYNY